MDVHDCQDKQELQVAVLVYSLFLHYLKYDP